MKIGAMGSAAMQPTSNNPSQLVDTESKEIQTQITNAQNKLQQISSDQNMSDEEKSRLRQEIQKQISELNNRLRKHQLEIRQQQQHQAQNMQKTSQDTRQPETSEQTEESKRQTDTRQADDSKRAQEARRRQEDRKVQEARKAQETRQFHETRKSQDTRQTQDTRSTEDISSVQDVRQTSDTRQTEFSADRPDTDEQRTTDIPVAEMKAVVSADTAVKHAAAQGQVSSSISNKARVLEGEIRQDSRSDRNTTSKETELESLEQKAAAASSAQMSILSNASGEVRRVNVKDNVNRIPADNNQTDIAKKSATVATGFSPENTANKGKTDAYLKGKMFSSVNFSF